MVRLLRFLLIAVPAGGALAAAAVLSGKSRLRRVAAGLRGRLIRNARDPLAKGSALDVPEPVRRYLTFAIPPGARPIRTATLRQTGEFRMGGIGSVWKSLKAAQSFSSTPPAFVWDARIRLAPLIAIRVHDSYLDGEGAIRATAASLIPLVHRRGTRELNEGALMRFLAEAVWIPTRLIPEEGLRWEEMDARRSRAILEDGDTRAELEFTFGDDGRVESIYSPGRFRDVNGVGVPTPWICRLDEWGRVDGFRVPLAGEVAWLLPEGDLVYWRARISEIRFEPTGRVTEPRPGPAPSEELPARP